EMITAPLDMRKADMTRLDTATEIGIEIERSDIEITANRLIEVLIATASVITGRPTVANIVRVGIMDLLVEVNTALTEDMERNPHEIGTVVTTGEDQIDTIKVRQDMEDVTRGGAYRPSGHVKPPRI